MKMSSDVAHTIQRNPLESSKRFKFYAIGLFCIIDLYLNGMTDYRVQEASAVSDKMKQGQGFLFLIQIVAQLSVFAALLLLMFETFPFQVGLYQVLISKFRHGLIIMTIYFSLTCIVGSFRLVHINQHIPVGYQWGRASYSVLSTVHKLVSPLYYAFVIQMSVELTHPIFSCDEYWKRSKIIIAQR